MQPAEHRKAYSETFTKAERICSRRIIDRLFGGGNPSMAAFPLRAVYMPTDATLEQPSVAVLISVPKRKLHHAVDRNRMKRQVREAYRRNKHALLASMEAQGKHLDIAFICIADHPCTTTQVTASVCKILRRINEKYT